MKRKLIDVKVAFLSGSGSMHFYKKRYIKAIRCLEYVIRNESETDKKAVTHSILGQSYLATNNTEKALIHLSTAYEMYRKEDATLSEKTEQEDFKALAAAYVYLLRKSGSDQLAMTIEQEVLKQIATQK